MRIHGHLVREVLIKTQLEFGVDRLIQVPELMVTTSVYRNRRVLEQSKGTSVDRQERNGL
jgi:hypothetical protein